MRKSAHSPEHRLLIQLLVDARQAAGLTQQECAARLDVQQSFVARYESGQRRIDLIELLQIAKALGVDSINLVRRIQSLDSTTTPPTRKQALRRVQRRGPYKEKGAKRR